MFTRDFIRGDFDRTDCDRLKEAFAEVANSQNAPVTSRINAAALATFSLRHKDDLCHSTLRNSLQSVNFYALILIVVYCIFVILSYSIEPVLFFFFPW